MERRDAGNARQARVSDALRRGVVRAAPTRTDRGHRAARGARTLWERRGSEAPAVASAVKRRGRCEGSRPVPAGRILLRRVALAIGSFAMAGASARFVGAA
jgi:hypothetical protein